MAQLIIKTAKTLRKKIIIEVDWGQQAAETKEDTERDEWLRSQGFKVIRLWNNKMWIISKLVDDPERIQGVKDSGVQVKC